MAKLINSPLTLQEYLRVHDFLRDFFLEEYGYGADEIDLTDPYSVELAYSTMTDEELPSQAYADFVHHRIIRTLGGKVLEEWHYLDLDRMLYDLYENLDGLFDRLVCFDNDQAAEELPYAPEYDPKDRTNQ